MAKKTTAKAKIKGDLVWASGIKKKKGYLYFIDRNGDIREVKAKKGGTKGVKRKCSGKK